MGKTTNLIGRQFGTLTVVEKITQKEINGVTKRGIWWRCKCTCGGEATPNTNAAINLVRSCPNCITNNFRETWLGVVVKSKNYGEFKVLKLTNGVADIKFLETGYEAQVGYKELRLGSVKDLLLPTVSGVGYLGVGKYQAKIHVNGKVRNSPAYEVWNGMLKRCYNERWQDAQKRTSYRDVTVDDRWHNFQNFAKWYEDNKPSYSPFDLDKDLKIIGNREYSPEACTFVPIAVNSLFTGTKDNRDLPRGVHFCKDKMKYIVQIHVGERTAKGNAKQSYLGAYLDKDIAIQQYLVAKTEQSRQLANKYKNVLDPVVYFNLVNKVSDFI